MQAGDEGLTVGSSAHLAYLQVLRDFNLKLERVRRLQLGHCVQVRACCGWLGRRGSRVVCPFWEALPISCTP